MTWNFTVDGSTKMPNGHMDAIEPYDYRAFQPFSTTYLPGYMADKYDEDVDTCQARAHSRMQNSVSSELSASTLSAFAEMPLVMDTYTHTTETENKRKVAAWFAGRSDDPTACHPALKGGNRVGQLCLRPCCCACSAPCRRQRW